MGNSTFHPIVAFLRYKRKNEEAIMLTNVITTPDYYVILTRTSLLRNYSAIAIRHLPSYNDRMVLMALSCD